MHTHHYSVHEEFANYDALRFQGTIKYSLNNKIAHYS